MAINPQDLFNKYKNLLSGAGKALSNMIPAVGAYKAVKQIATPQYKPQLLSSVQQINKRLPMGINIPTSRQGLQQNIDRSLGITPQVKLAEQKMLSRKRLNPEEQKLVTGQAMDFALNFMGGSPEGVIGASLKSVRSAQALKKSLPEIRSIKNLIDNVMHPDIMQQRAIDQAFTKYAPKNLSNKMKKLLNNPKERIEYLRSLLPSLEYQALNPSVNVGTNIKSIRGDIPTQATKGVEGVKVKPVSVIPTPKTLSKIAKREDVAKEQLAKKEFIEWQKAFQKQEGLVKVSKLVDDAVKRIGKSTTSPFIRQPENLKDISGISSYFRDVHRNFAKVFGKNFQGAKEMYLDPLFVGAKGKYLDEQTSLIKGMDDTIIKKLGIKPKSQESRAVQLLGEKQISEIDLVDKFGKEKAGKIIQADVWFRQKYDTLLDEVNKVRGVIYPNNPEKIIPKRQDYYRHFRELAQGYKALFNVFETPAGISSKLAGVSYQTKPKSKWLSFAQRRLGTGTEEDAVGGFLNYIKASSYAKHIDPQIERFRSLANELSEATVEGDSAGNLNNFILYLNRFADDLSGKSNPVDRVMQEMGGRKLFRVMDWANTRIKANVILGNLSSSVAQIFNVPQGIADAGPINAVKGMGRSLADIFYPNNAIKSSPFIKERYFRAYDKFDTGMLSSTKKFAAWMTQVLDEVGTKYIWNSEYAKAISQNVKDAVTFADDATRKLVAGRGIGEVPIGQKSRIFQMIAPFQLEVANLWWVMKDMVDAKQFGKLATLFVANHVFNKGAEAIRGSGVTFDPMQAMIDAYQTFEQEEDKKIGAIRAGGRIAGEVMSNMPFGQTAAAMYPEYGFKIPGTEENLTRKEFFGREDPTRFGGGLLVAKGLQDPLYKLVPPFGGMQIKKTIEGSKNIAQGYSESKGGKVQFPIEKTPSNVVKSLAFGKYGTKEATEYFKEERTPLGEKQSEYFKSAQDKFKVYNDVLTKRAKDKRLETAMAEVKKTHETQVVDNSVLYWDAESATGKTINISPVTKPKLTGDTELDKIKISTYNSKLNTQIKNIAKLEELGQISSSEAEKKIKELTEMKVTKAKKPKKITIKVPKMPKVKLTKVKTKKVKLPKPKKVKKYSLKKIKLRKVKLSAKLA